MSPAARVNATKEFRFAETGRAVLGECRIPEEAKLHWKAHDDRRYVGRREIEIALRERLELVVFGDLGGPLMPSVVAVERWRAWRLWTRLVVLLAKKERKSSPYADEGAEPVITIPRTALEKKCPRGCGASIYWVETPRADRKPGTVNMPVDPSVAGGVEPDAFSDGRGVNHFTVCPAEQ